MILKENNVLDFFSFLLCCLIIVLHVCLLYCTCTWGSTIIYMYITYMHDYITFMQGVVIHLGSTYSSTYLQIGLILM